MSGGLEAPTTTDGWRALLAEVDEIIVEYGTNARPPIADDVAYHTISHVGHALRGIIKLEERRCAIM